MVIDDLLSEQEIKEYRQLGYPKKFSFEENDIWNATKELYSIHKDEKIVSEITGIPLELLKKTLLSKGIIRTNEVIDIELIEEEDYGLLKMAEANGINVDEMIKKILREKLIQEKFLEEE